MPTSRLRSVVSAMAEGGPRRKGAARASSLKLEVDVVRYAEVWRGAIGDAIVKRAARAAFLTAPPPAQGSYEITILLTNDAEMRDLNREWRGKDAPTNVPRGRSHRAWSARRRRARL